MRSPRLREQAELGKITHLVVASCTGFVAPGVDQIIAAALGLEEVERTLIGFMGCYAAAAVLRTAHHIVRSDPAARVLAVTVELSSLHLQSAEELEPLLAELQFGDGAAAALVTADPQGLGIVAPFTASLPQSDQLIRWTIGDAGFEMVLSGEVPGRIGAALQDAKVRSRLLADWRVEDVRRLGSPRRRPLDPRCGRARSGARARQARCLTPRARRLWQHVLLHLDVRAARPAGATRCAKGRRHRLRPRPGRRGLPLRARGVTVRQVPALIVGGGPAGSAAAIRLAAGGVAAELIERQAAPQDVVCGGFLGWDALAVLKRLGVDPAELGARPIHRLRLVSGRRVAEAPLPRPAAGLSRRTLDAALLDRAAAAGALVRRGVSAKAAEGKTIRLDTGEEIEAQALFLATGKHELRGLQRPLTRRAAGAVGLRTSFEPSQRTRAELASFIELHPFDGGYAGLLLQEDGRVNFCLSVAAARLRSSGGVPELLRDLAREAPRFGERLAEAGDEPWLSISNVPYGWRVRDTEANLFRLGDQAAVIASLAGDGIAIALTSGLAAADAHLAGRSANQYQQAFCARAARPLGVAQGLRWAAERPVPRRLLVALARAAPRAAGWAALLTRIEPKPALSGR
jgi:flavin-dependent dehydrogenase